MLRFEIHGDEYSIIGSRKELLALTKEYLEFSFKMIDEVEVAEAEEDTKGKGVHFRLV